MVAAEPVPTIFGGTGCLVGDTVEGPNSIRMSKLGEHPEVVVLSSLVAPLVQR
jgi:hypothetical protein